MKKDIFASRRAMFEPKKKEIQNVNPIKSKKEQIKTNKANENKDSKIQKFEKSNDFIKVEKPKIMNNSETISEENPDMIIYKYPKVQFANSKIILLIGYNTEKFINSFINIYSDICYEDKFRYKIENTDSNDSYKIYNIKARTAKYNLKIITLQSSLQNIDFIKDILNIFYKNKIINFINCIFITLEEKKQLHKNGIIGFLVLMILFKIENLKDRINIIYSSENSSDNTLTDNEDKYYNDIINEKNNYIILSEYYNNSAIIKAYNPKYFFLNNNIIYEKNTENEWKMYKIKFRLFR